VVAYKIKTALEAQTEQIGRQEAHKTSHSAQHSESERQGHAQEQTGEKHEHTVRASASTVTIREQGEAPGRNQRMWSTAKAEANGHGISEQRNQQGHSEGGFLSILGRAFHRWQFGDVSVRRLCPFDLSLLLVNVVECPIPPPFNGAFGCG
jgi:hypothetical protein